MPELEIIGEAPVKEFRPGQEFFFIDTETSLGEIFGTRITYITAKDIKHEELESIPKTRPKKLKP